MQKPTVGSVANPNETELIQNVEKLSVDTQRLHESQSVASVGSWETDLNTLEVVWTPETYRIFDVSESEFHPTHDKFLQMVHPDEVMQTSEVIPRGHGELILLVDDEAAIRQVTADTLLDFGYRVLEATNGAEAVAVYLQHQNEIMMVLTDVSMPVMSGTALITALKSINSKVRVVVTSGLPMSSELAKAMDFSVNQFLLKPYNAEKLLRTIHKELQV